MGCFKRILIALCLFIILQVNNELSAETINNKIDSILSIEDKQEIIVRLNKLLNDPSIDDSNKLKVRLSLTKSYFMIGALDKALLTVNELNSQATKQRDIQSIAQAKKWLGILSYYSGESATALKFYRESLYYYPKEKHPLEHANLLNNIGLVYTTLGDSRKALEAYKLAEPLYQEFGSELDLIDLRYNIATLYISLRDYDHAITILHEVIEKRTLLNLNEEVALAKSALGVSYKYAGDFEKALQYTSSALKYFEENKQYYHVASELHNLSELYNQLDRFVEAETIALEAYKLAKQQKHQKSLANSLNSLAKAQFNRKAYESALKSINESNEIANQIGYKSLINSNLGISALIYAAQNKSFEAISSYQRFVENKNKTSNRQLNMLLAEFESEQLSKQVEQLKQNERLKSLEDKQLNQKRNFIILALSFFLVLAFLIYRRHIESHIKKELELKVRQRTRELEVSTKELKAANKVKNRFLANMSHEIRTPLTAVLGQSEAIVRGDVDPLNITKEVEIINENSQHLLTLINDILDLSKIEENKLELENVDIDLIKLLDNLLNMFSSQATKKGIKFEIIHIFKAPFFINVDGLRLKQILINLCSNAIKFTSKGKVTLSIDYVDEHLVFVVEDSGIGMSKNQISHIFDSFTQADNSISRRFGGSGLGLFLSDHLAKIMGGTITVKSKELEGSVFTLTLPMKKVVKTNMFIDPEEHKKGSYFSGQILIAEDHNDNRRMITRLLESLGLEVITASNGIEVLELYEFHHPSLILLDIQMPVMDGIEAFKRLRECGCKLPIYALTANAMSHEIEQYLTLGFDGHLTKPIERKVFIQTLEKYFQKENVFSRYQDAKKSLDVDMSDLKLEFIQGLHKEQELFISNIDKKNLIAIKSQMHKLAGASQMFGFNTISEKALRIEKELLAKQIDIGNDLVLDLLKEIRKHEK